MGLFTAKRRKSVNSGQTVLAPLLLEQVATPIFARHQQTNNGIYTNDKMEMPDLRFSKMDLELDMNNYKVGGGQDLRPGSVLLGAEDRRKSKLALLNFNNTNNNDYSKTILPATLKEKGSNPQLAAMVHALPSNYSDNASITSSQKGPGMGQDRKKLVASATEAMNLDVPVKAPSRQGNPSPLGTFGGGKDTSKMSKKELKKEEKERLAHEKEIMESERVARIESRARMERERASRAIMEKDLARQAARDKRESESLSKRVIYPDEPIAARNKSIPDLRLAQSSVSLSSSDHRRMLNPSAHNNHFTRALPPQQSSNASSRSKSPAPSSTSSRRPPNAPPSQKPPSLPTATFTNQRQNLSSQNRGENVQFPRQKGAPQRGQSTVPAADGFARPFVNRGQNVTIEKRFSKQEGTATESYKMPMMSSPPMQAKAKLGSNRPIQSSYQSPQKMARGSSSDDGGTSTSAEGPSLDSNTSIDDNDDNNANDHFVDANHTFTHQSRPRRDEEREERAQSRLSGNFDAEVIKAARAEGGGHHHTRNDSATDKFSALLAASRPGGAGDRSTELKEANVAKTKMEAQRQRYLNNDQSTAHRSPPPPPPEPIKRIREMAPPPKRRQNIVCPELIDSGIGWSCKGVRDLHIPNVHDRLVAETRLVPRVKEGNSWQRKQVERDHSGNPIIEMVEQQINIRYNDLFELIWTSTTPDVISRILSELDLSDLKALRQVSHSIRFTLNVHDNREMILNKHLASIGYRTWTQVKGVTSTRTNTRIAPSNMSKDPCPLSFSDCEAFLISHDLLPEYIAVGKDYAANPSGMDPRMPRLAQASTRAYSRVLTRLRLQPVFRIPKPMTGHSTGDRSENSSSGLNADVNLLDIRNTSLPKHNSYYPAKASPAMSNSTISPLSPVDSGIAFSPLISSPLTLSLTPKTVHEESSLTRSNTVQQITSPWKPGRAALYRVWVPASDPNGWLSDEEMTQCESQLFKAGIWNFLQKGDVVWNTAVGDQVNEGKYIFDGRYLRDLSYAHDPIGHLPSWLNCVLYSPSYWHNIIYSSSPRPIIFFDISPWKDQILNSLRLVQDHVEGFSTTGNRYRIAKWLYRSAANISSGQIISKMSGALEIVDEGWNGRIVIETEGTAEHAKALISRCAGPTASPREKAALLATVMGDAKAASRAMNTNDTRGLTHSSFTSAAAAAAAAAAPASRSNEVQNSPWMIMRERSRPGLIWIKLAVNTS